MAIKYRCPDADCRKTFPWESGAEPPNVCPHCGYSYRETADDEIVMPNILSARTKSIEGVARGVMDGSEQRVQMATELAGGTPEDYSALKITNLNDGRQSEFAAKDVSNPVTQAMQATPGLSGFQSNGAAFAAGTASGPVPRAGANFASRLTLQHQHHKNVVASSGKTR